ncbi:MAG: hypothetical protein ACTHU0_36005, partial [Kofleriaceae bacterium]
MPSYAHAMDAAACAGFLAYWAATLGQLRWRRYVWLGVLLGIAANVRIQDFGFGIVLVLELGGLAWQALRGEGAPGARIRSAAAVIGRGVAVLAIAVAMHAPQFYEWKLMYGSWLTTPQGSGQMRYGHPMVLELLFSSRNGWLSTTPIAYLGTIGLVIGAIAGPRLGRHVRLVCGGLLLSIVVQVYFNAVTYEWWSGASFGQRRMCSSTISNVVGLAVLLCAVGRLAARRRLSALAQHVLFLATVGYLIAWNLGWVLSLDHGRAAGRDDKRMCCSDVWSPLAKVAQPVYDRVGNPFTFPANALFAIEHGVDLKRWDLAVGSYALVPPVLGYEDGSYRRHTAVFNQVVATGAPYLLDGWGPTQQLPAPARQAWRWTTAPRAGLLLPLLMPEPHRIRMTVAANVAPGQTIELEVWCNGTRVATQRVGAHWVSFTFDTDGTVGHNEIELVAPVAPYQVADPTGPLAPPTATPVGVAVAPLFVSMPPR